MQKTRLPFGRWPSPVTAVSIAEGALRFGRIQVDDRDVIWSETRPAEQGRSAIARLGPDGTAETLLQAPYSARSRVHEYGGGEFIASGGKIYFVNDADQDVYELGLGQDRGEGPRRLTRLPNVRFADFCADPLRDRLVAVGERHHPQEESLPENALWSVPLSRGEGQATASPLFGGYDFFASPRVSPTGDRVAFLAWQLPDMPWDGARLLVATIAAEGGLERPERIAGGDGSACFQPEWGADGALYFVWDEGGFGNLYRWSHAAGVSQLTEMSAELSMPLWSLNARSYALLSGDRAYLSFVEKGETGFGILDLKSGTIARRNDGLTAVQTLASDGETIVLAGMMEREAPCLVKKRAAPDAPAIIRRSDERIFDAALVPPCQRIAFPGPHGDVYGFYHGPLNSGAQGPATTPPPLIIQLHGGPTSGVLPGLRPRTLFFTSRGFAWLDLNYSGSTGYGRAYRQRLYGKWGVADVDDTIAAAAYAASEGLADPKALFMTGGSAGGYTVLTTAATSGIFAGGVSYYGICDLIALHNTTHKFESRYDETLLGTSPKAGEAVYRERSAIQRVDRIETPLLLFQGAEDKVVPKEQSLEIANALRTRGLRAEYHEFAGEGHGFRKAETIRACQEIELAFFLSLMSDSA